MHLNWLTVLRSCTQLPEDELAVLALRLTFGGRPCPPEWGSLSESVCDLSNAILCDPAWNPLELYNPAALKIPTRRPLADDNPFGEARELVVDVPVEAEGHSDVYIDDTCALGVDLPGSNNVTKIERAVLLALETTARQLMENEPIPRDDMPAKNKFKAEAAAEETKMILGWHFNFRLLAVSLPDNKFIAWSGSITIMLDNKGSTAKELDTCIGKIGHVSWVLPGINHFLSGLRCLHHQAKNRRSVTIPDRTQADC
jgi:hypothetical protein